VEEEEDVEREQTERHRRVKGGVEKQEWGREDLKNRH